MPPFASMTWIRFNGSPAPAGLSAVGNGSPEYASSLGRGRTGVKAGVPRKKPSGIAPDGVVSLAGCPAQASKDRPQPQFWRALGLVILKPLSFRSSLKSTTVPRR
jgi:hypothetical protein